MKKFLAIYVGTAGARDRAQWDKMDEKQRKAIEGKGIDAWMEWGTTHSGAIVDTGTPGSKYGVRRSGVLQPILEWKTERTSS